jgi:peroxiredoxin Q/BCP
MSGLRDHKAQFDDSSAQVLGVSLDSLQTQTRFADSLKLPFPLLADQGGKAARAYGVKGLLWANRTTFVIDDNGRISAIFEGKDAIDPAGVLSACRGKTLP